MEIAPLASAVRGDPSGCQPRGRVRTSGVAVAAARFVRVERADDDRLTRVGRGPPVDQPLRRRRRPAAAVANGLQLVDELGAGEELGHRAERQAAEVLVEARGDDANAAVSERERGVDDRRLEELHLVDPDDVAAAGPRDELGAAVDRDGGHPHARVADDVGGVVAVVDPRLEEETRCPAISARRSRRIISSLLPLNIGPQTTSSQPPRCGGTRITTRILEPVSAGAFRSAGRRGYRPMARQGGS